MHPMNNPGTKKAADKKKTATASTGFKEKSPLPFDRQNYMLMAVCFAVIVIGFIIMAGTEDIFSFSKMVIAPIIVLIGYGIGMYGIMRVPRAKAE